MGLHASPSRWYEKSLSRSRKGAERRRTSLAVPLTTTIAVTVVMTAALVSGWVWLNGGDPTSTTMSAGLRPAAPATTAVPATGEPDGSASPSSFSAPPDPLSELTSAGSAPNPLAPPVSDAGSPSRSAEAESSDGAAPTSAEGDEHPAATDTTTKAAATADDTASTPKKPAAPAEPAKKRTTAKKPKVIASGRCGASYYDEGQMTASGERFNPHAMTAAHKTLPMGSRVRVTNPNNGKTVTVRINDRGPYVGGRCLDLSRAAFDAIGNLDTGAMSVEYAVLAH
ncbi:septal ring lytic transglycosylase RlpA family protein [Sphaerisporangium sp. NPDC004334]